MALIEHGQLTIGSRVYYRYGNLEQVNGPFVVKKLFSDYQGKHVSLEGTGKVLNVALADDEDFGAPIFYDNPNGI